ncbi:MAG: DUF3857 and transglutaminase domain-containing protein [Ferruginibacter sp.]
MRKLITSTLPVLFLLISHNSHAQQSYTDWEQNFVAHKIKSMNEKESAVILEEQRTHEIKVDDNKEAYIHAYTRRLMKLNDDRGVEMYNKIYIYIPSNTEVLEIKARTMQPNGKVVNLPTDKILDVEEEGKHYKKFALEGIEKGSEIEYFVHQRRPVSTFGVEIYLSSKTPFEKASFTLIVPAHLVFKVKGYNGFKVDPDTVINNKRIVTATSEDISGFEEEKYSSSSPYEENVQYKLAYNLDKDKNTRMNTWNELAKNVYNNYYTLEGSELKAVEKFYKQLKLDDAASEESKIIAIEDYLKNNISNDANAIGEDADKIEHIIKTKTGGCYGYTRLFIGLLEKAGVKSRIVFPSKRNDLPIDEDFENYHLIDDMILYFPSTGNFLDPIDISYRYPYTNPNYAGTKGLFLKGTTLGDFKTAIASFDSIPLQPYEKNTNNIYVDVKFNKDMDSLLMHFKQTWTGYGASSYRPIYNYLPKDKQEEITNEILKGAGYSDKISNAKVENTAMTAGLKEIPLDLSGDIATAGLTENAGKKILIKVGAMIGQQVQLYQEKKRQLPVLMEYPHSEDRVINLTLPDGYMITNLYEINMDVSDKEKSMGFLTSYTQKGSLLTITIHEYYKSIAYPVSRFEEFRKVINASADFNKLVLVMEKKDK